MQNLLLSLTLFILSCNISDYGSGDSTEVVNEFERLPCENLNSSELPELVWKQEFIQEDLASTIGPFLTDSLIIISRSYDFDPPEELLCYNKITGKYIWSWSDYFDSQELLFNNFYINNNLMYISTFGSLYIVELITGKSILKKNYGRMNTTGTYGDANIVSLTYNTDSSYVAALFNSHNNALIPCISIPKSTKYKGSISVPLVVNKTCYFSFNSYHFETKENKSQLFRVDLENNLPIIKWEKEINGIGTIGNFGYKLLGNRLYVTDRDLYCIDISDGSTLWQQPNIYGGPAELIIADYKLIVASNHLNPSIYAFNLTTGEVLWNEPISGTSSPLQFHNCVIYTVGGGDGMLHAIDINSGRHLYKMISPDEQQNSNLYFDNCTVDTENNSIILTNFKYLMKYQLPNY